MTRFGILRHGLPMLLCILFLLLVGCESNKCDYENQIVIESKEKMGEDTSASEVDNQKETFSHPGKNSPLIMPIGELIAYFDEHPEEIDRYTGGPTIPYPVESSSTTGG